MHFSNRIHIMNLLRYRDVLIPTLSSMSETCWFEQHVSLCTSLSSQHHLATHHPPYLYQLGLSPLQVTGKSDSGLNKQKGKLLVHRAGKFKGRFSFRSSWIKDQTILWDSISSHLPVEPSTPDSPLMVTIWLPRYQPQLHSGSNPAR